MTVPTPANTAATTLVVTNSADETRALAAALGAVAQPADRIALLGPLGAGKTQFAKGFATGLGVLQVVNSPSFTLMAEYAGRLPLFHQDLYRLNGAEEALAGGLIDERQEAGVTLIEWGERLPQQLDARRLIVRFTVLGDDEREIAIEMADASQQRYVDAAQELVGTVILVLDTATRMPCVAIAGADGALIAERQWKSLHRHGEELLERVDAVLTEAGIDRLALDGVIVGTGPGSFTGLRIGLATAKTIAYSLAIPLVGISSTLALALAASTRAGHSPTGHPDSARRRRGPLPAQCRGQRQRRARDRAAAPQRRLGGSGRHARRD